MLTCQDCDVTLDGSTIDKAYAYAQHWVDHTKITFSLDIFENAAKGSDVIETLFIGRAG